MLSIPTQQFYLTTLEHKHDCTVTYHLSSHKNIEFDFMNNICHFVFHPLSLHADRGLTLTESHLSDIKNFQSGIILIVLYNVCTLLLTTLTPPILHIYRLSYVHQDFDV